MDDKTYLDEVYEQETPADQQALYDEWSQSYDTELTEEGYATPARCTAALARFITADAAILDFGCGTGLSGTSLADAGFGCIDGADVSAGMLATAATKGVYRELFQIEPDATSMPGGAGAYDAVIAVGAIGKGAAPASVLEPIVSSLGPSGLFCFSFNDHTLDDPDYMDPVQRWIDEGRVTVRFREHGDHLPKIDLGADVFVLERSA